MWMGSFPCSITATLTHIHTQIIFPAQNRSNITVFVGYYQRWATPGVSHSNSTPTPLQLHLVLQNSTPTPELTPALELELPISDCRTSTSHRENSLFLCIFLFFSLPVHLLKGIYVVFLSFFCPSFTSQDISRSWIGVGKNCQLQLHVNSTPGQGTSTPTPSKKTPTPELTPAPELELPISGYYGISWR
jgi:hypothetical protein